MEVLQAMDRFPELRVLVAGDIMLDAYVIGEVHRVSPEAPVPVLDVVKQDARPGGAANVAENVRALGAQVAVCAVVGDDAAGETLRNLMHSRTVNVTALLTATDRPTTVKTRFMSGGQHLLRADEESTRPVSEPTAIALVAAFTALLDAFCPHVVVLEDYDKGVLTSFTIPAFLAACGARAIPVAVDPKLRQFTAYSGVQLFKPNLKELKEGTGIHSVTKSDSTSIEQAIETLLARQHPEIALVTLSELGVWVHAPHRGVVHQRRPAHPREIVDVSGAGDTVVAVAALLLACGVEPVALAEAANLAGGLACERPGVCPITAEELRAEWRAYKTVGQP